MIKRRDWILGLVLGAVQFAGGQAQESFPAAPADHSRIYVVDEKGNTVALPFETGTTPLKTEAVADKDKTSFIEFKGEQGGWKIHGTEPRFYLFVPDRPDVHPPFIVRLTSRKGARRVAVMAQRGLKGFAVNSEEIVKPRYRVLAREGGMLYMEIRPREPLTSGQSYAILGGDLQRIATFDVILVNR